MRIPNITQISAAAGTAWDTAKNAGNKIKQHARTVALATLVTTTPIQKGCSGMTVHIGEYAHPPVMYSAPPNWWINFWGPPVYVRPAPKMIINHTVIQVPSMRHSHPPGPPPGPPRHHYGNFPGPQIPQ